MNTRLLFCFLFAAGNVLAQAPKSVTPEPTPAKPPVLAQPEKPAAAQAEIANAERNLILVGSLLEPLRVRNPLLATFAGNNSSNP